MEEQLNGIQKRLDEIENRLNQQHAEQFGWAKSIYENQQNIKRFVGIRDDSLPFEPYYNRAIPLNPEEPEIYNKYGERLKVMFISDQDGAHGVYGGGRHIYFDRYNYGLKNHLYTMGEAFRLVGKPDARFASIDEPPSIIPQIYERILKEKDFIENNFEMVFSHDVKILTSLKNAKFMPVANIWYGQNSVRMAGNVNNRGGGDSE